MAISKQSGVFVKEGRTLNYTPSADVAKGAILVVSGMNCLALWGISANTAGTLHILQRGELIDITTDEAIGETDAGTPIYIDENGLVSKSATHTESQTTVNNTLLGYTENAVTSTDLTFSLVCA